MAKMKIAVFALAILGCVTAAGRPSAAAPRIYWGNDVPRGWTGNWPEALRTVPERTAYARTTSSLQLLEFIDAFRWKSESVHVFTMFTSPLGRTCPVLVLASPRVTTPAEAVASGKTVVYLQGSIHPSEAESKEALLVLVREILLGRLRPLLDDLVILVCPSFNVDGNDMWRLNDGTPHILSGGTNAAGMNLNRDAIKLETVEVNALNKNVFNRWDPVLIYDGHAMENVQHGYAIGYATSSVPAAHPGPRDHVFDRLFPAVRNAVRRDFGLEVFTHCEVDARWPPTTWSHAGAFWTTEAKFVAAAYALRNRMSILAETPLHLSFERKIYAQYALLAGILRYAAAHGREMRAICRQADREVVEAVRTQAESGRLRNFVAGTYISRGKIDILAYREKNVPVYLPGTSVRAAVPASLLGPPELVPGVEDMTRAVGTVEAAVPRGYLFPAELAPLAEKLRTLGVAVDVLAKPATAAGEEFAVDRLVKSMRGGFSMTELEGAFAPSPSREFPAGTFRVDLAQPAANMAFYALEPQAADGFAAWGLLDAWLRSAGVETRSVVSPVYKYFRLKE
jgi:hypothetical protein